MEIILTVHMLCACVSHTHQGRHLGGGAFSPLILKKVKNIL